MNIDHNFEVRLEWSGNLGEGTTSYRGYSRHNEITAVGKPAIEGSSARVFHGDAERWNPEELLIGALSQCHMLSYLHVAVSRGIVVTAYHDEVSGTMKQTDNGGGHFTSVTLRPVVTISAGSVDDALDAHTEANKKCFIAASVNFPVLHQPRIIVEE
ncbi:MAG: OsmC family protein [Rhodoglobus sp.]